MRAIKSILRWFLGLQALVFSILSAGIILGSLNKHHRASAPSYLWAHTDPLAGALISYGVGALLVLMGPVSSMAWWTTRKPRAVLNVWALAASALNLVLGGFFLWFSFFAPILHTRFSPNTGFWFLVFGLAGLFIFSRRETMPDPAVAARKCAPIAGDRTSLATRHVVTALSVVAQIAILFVWAHWGYTHRLLRHYGISWIVLITVASIATTFIHECGHAVLAWCFEMGFLSFRVGPFHAVKREGKWNFKFHAAGLITPGGSVGAVPTHPDQPRWEEIVMIAAGPCANLLIGAAAVWAVVHDRWASYAQTWELVAYMGAFSLIGAVLNLFPFLSEDGGYSDGARILQIVTHSPLDDYHRAISRVASTAITSLRYRDLDIAQIERAAMLFPHDVRGLRLLLCACQYYEESGQLPEASAALAAAQTIYDENAINLPGPLHTVFVIGRAYLDRNAAAARLWWDRMVAKENNRTNVDFWLAKAALLWIEGDHAQAEDAWQEANLEAQSLPQFGAYEFDRFRCAGLREALDQTPVPVLAPLAAAVPAPTPTPILESVPAPIPLPVIATAPVAVPAQIVPALVSAPLAAVAESDCDPVITSGPVAVVALAPAPMADPPSSPIAASSILLFAIGESAAIPPQAVEAIIPVAATEMAVDPMDVLASRLGALTRPVAKPAPAAPIVETMIDPVAGSVTRIPAGALIAAPARINLTADSPEPAALTPKPNAPAVPAAFARRPRPAPLPLGSAPNAFLAAEMAAFETPALEMKQASETSVVAASGAAPLPERVALYDSLDFIRAAAIENLNANVS